MVVDEVHIVHPLAVFDQHVADAVGLSMSDELVVCPPVAPEVSPKTSPNSRQIQFTVVVAGEDDEAMAPA
jgi:hypothetical protein